MHHKPYTVGIVGARGYVGREMIRCIAADDRFELTLASSREHAGQPVAGLAPELQSDLRFTASDPAAVAAAQCDVVILGLPNGLAAPFVAAVDQAAPDTLLVDLSADYRHQPGWVFGMSDLHEDQISGAKRIANPGCYATAAILALYPLKDLLTGTPSIFGMSGYSGAGTRPSEKNDPVNLAQNILPYGFAGHGHQGEIGGAIGRPVRFMPHVVSFFRGLLVTVSAPLFAGTTVQMINARYRAHYGANPTITLTDKVPPTPKMVAETPMAALGGAKIDPATGHLAVACAHDNLLKGAATQAFENVKIALGVSRRA